MSKHAAYVPKHRGTPDRPLVEGLQEAPKKALKTTFLLSALAVVGTGTAVGGGVVLSGHHVSDAVALDLAAPEHAKQSTAAAPAAAPSAPASSAGSSAASATPVADRAVVVSRSDSRDRTDPAKAAALSAVGGTAARAVVHTEDMTASGDPKAIASALLGSFGWNGGQFGCLVNLWNRESGWRTNAANPSGAYGIPQALPGSKMASAGPDWRTNAETQIRWGLGYIQERYGSPCGAWGHSQAHGWY